MPGTIDQLIKPVIEVCEYFQLVPWQLQPRHVDHYFSGPGKRARSTIRTKMNQIDGYFAFLEQRYAGEIGRRFGVLVESPVDLLNRPRRRGDFGLRIPPSRAAMKEFFCRWHRDLPSARKEAVACRNYVMAKVAYLSGVRAAELCATKITDVHWEAGQRGRFLVNGKGARGSGPRQREAYLCECWKHDTGRYPTGPCGRCRRELPLSAPERLCRGCLIHVREHGELDRAPFTQLQLALGKHPVRQLKHHAHRLGYDTTDRS
ncbi:MULTISPECIES: hypothetical protein [unclassified Streptomyces]|uniref:hypothetical protein n=1 Tax=unclassified Streptomyces TaxID=2593676 RepID=UPI00386D1BA8